MNQRINKIKNMRLSSHRFTIILVGKMIVPVFMYNVFDSAKLRNVLAMGLHRKKINLKI